MNKAIHGVVAAMMGLTLQATPALAADPIKIAFIETMSGPFGASGLMFVKGARFGVAQVNAAGGVNHRMLKMAEYDNPAGTMGVAEKFRAAVADGTQVIIQSASSTVAAQMLEETRKHNLRDPAHPVIFITTGAEAADLTGSKCSFWFFRLNSTAYVRQKALVETMKAEGALGSRVFLINENYSFGQDNARAAAKYVTAEGATVVGNVLHEMGKVQDFSPYISQIKQSGATTMMSADWGNDVILLLKAAANAKLDIVMAPQGIESPGAIAAVGDAAGGDWMVNLYNPEAGGEAGKAFLGAYKAAMHEDPFAIGTAQTYTGLMFLAKAMGQVAPADGPMDVRALAAAMETTQYDGPMGEIAMRKADHQAILPVAVSVVSRDAPFKADGTELGFKLKRLVPGSEAEVPADPDCKMDHPS